MDLRATVFIVPAARNGGEEAQGGESAYAGGAERGRGGICNAGSGVKREGRRGGTGTAGEEDEEEEFVAVVTVVIEDIRTGFVVVGDC